MTKLKKAFLALLITALLIFICTGATMAVYADTATDTVTNEEQTVAPDISGGENDLNMLVKQFTDYLKAKYGEDYEFYYNRIIERWGSVETYLLSLGDKLPEEYKSGWEKFVGWLGEYSVIWAPALALALVIVVAVIGKKQFNKIFEKAVATKLEPVIKELNLQSTATAAVMRALRAFLSNNKALLENNEGLAEAVKELESAEEELAK